MRQIIVEVQCKRHEVASDYYITKALNMFVRSLGYRNKFKRAKAWAEISAAMNINESLCQSRWKKIRDRYVKLHQKKLLTGSEGCVPESSFSLFSQLEFLSNHIQPRRTASSVAAMDCSPTEELSSFSPLEESSKSVDASIYFEPEEDLSSTPSTSTKRKSVRERDDPLAKNV